MESRRSITSLCLSLLLATLAAAHAPPTLSASSASTIALGAATTTAAAAPTLGLTASSYSASQTSGTIRVGIVRLGTATKTASVTYATKDGTAVAGRDYTRQSGTITWKAGETSTKVVSIPVSAIAFSGSRTLTLTLSNPTGATLNKRPTATVTINGSGTTQPPPTTNPAPTPVPSGAIGKTAAARLLSQGTFGATIDDINATSALTYSQWFTQQTNAAPSLYLPSTPNKDADWYDLWLTNAVTAKDQLRQRIAFALSELFVVSTNGGPLMYQNQATAAYMDLLVKNAFGNYRDLLEKVTLSPAMGQYLSMFRNDKPNTATGVRADENYAREIMQLFSVGLIKLNADGTVALDSNGRTIPTFTQAEVEGLARVFTGWASKPRSGSVSESSWQYDVDYVNPMVAYANHHDTGQKTIIGGKVIAAGGTAASDLKIALDTLFNHPNVGPFISKQLIQRLVASNPSPAYVKRVAAVFNNNGAGVRGDLAAVYKAILTDSEAVNVSSTGKLREPLIRLTNLWRAFNATDSSGKVAEYMVLLTSYQMFAQAPMQSPTVFNFFRPDYKRTGELSDLKLVAPEFQTTNESTLVLTQNRLQEQAYQFVDSAGKRYMGVDIDYSSNINNSTVLLKTKQWEAYAATPATLVEQLNLVLMAGNMPAAMKSTLVSYVSGIPASTPARRVIEAADLVINSPQYAIQF